MAVAIPESHHEFLTEARIGILSTFAPSGHPQQTAIWFLFEDGEIKLSLAPRSTRSRT